MNFETVAYQVLLIHNIPHQGDLNQNLLTANDKL